MNEVKKTSTLNQKAQKVWVRKRLVTLNWAKVDSDGSLFSRGKHDYYAILVRGIPEEHPEDCIVELYVTDKELSIVEIKNCAYREQIKLLSRSIVLGNLLPVTSIGQVVDEMKDTAESRENENPYSSISSDYTSRGR
ncbi:hypothetical protein E4G67_03010 [Candidatus Bathyarchaeota archaeon]|nr:MAG: hypothetical protein E4G67_03010 [Candidatus Bathyarchaeota archaeon]